MKYFLFVLCPLYVSTPNFQTKFFDAFLNSFEKILGKVGFAGRFYFYKSGISSTSHAISSPDTGILIQGPINDQASLKEVTKTINSYLQLFPETIIVLSTWNNSLQLPKEMLTNIRIIVVRSDDPGPSWPTNLHRQIQSTHVGLSAFPNNPNLLVVKTRTDQRFTNPISMALMQELSLRDTNPSRVWALSYGSGKYRIYGITDQFQFGTLGTLKEFWSPDTIDEKTQSIGSPSKGPINDLHYKAIAVHEILLAASFLTRKNHKLLWTWSDHEYCLAKYFGILDSSLIGFELLSRLRTPIDHVVPGMSAQQLKVESHLSHSEWFLISQGYNFLNPDELILNLALKVPKSDLKFVDAFWGNS